MDVGGKNRRSVNRKPLEEAGEKWLEHRMCDNVFQNKNLYKNDFHRWDTY